MFTKELLVKMYWERELSTKEIGKNLGVSGARVSLAMKALGVKTRTKSEAMSLAFKKHPELRALAVERGKKARGRRNTWWSADKLQEMRAHSRETYLNRLRGKISEETLRNLYLSRHKSYKDIESILNVTVPAIRDAMKLYNITPRTPSEALKGNPKVGVGMSPEKIQKHHEGFKLLLKKLSSEEGLYLDLTGYHPDGIIVTEREVVAIEYTTKPESLQPRTVKEVRAKQAGFDKIKFYSARDVAADRQW